MAHTKKRIPELDIIRGLLVLLLVVDHFFYDAGFFVNDIFPRVDLIASPVNDFAIFARTYWYSNWRIIIRQICLFIFFLISGICASFSNNNFRRSLKLMLFSAIATFLSFGYSYLTKHWDFLIDAGARPMYWLFPIFFCYGFSIFVYEVIKRLVKLITKKETIIAPMIVFAIGISILVVFFHYKLYNLPHEHYERSHFWKYILGFSDCYEDFDSWPLIPFMGYLFIGVFVGYIFYRKRESLIFKKDENRFVSFMKPISFFGRHSLWVYILHQFIIVPIMYGVFYLIIY